MAVNMPLYNTKSNSNNNNNNTDQEDKSDESLTKLQALFSGYKCNQKFNSRQGLKEHTDTSH
jgi:RecB family exonuclease